MKGEDDSWLLRYCSGVFLTRDREAQELFAELRILSSSVPLNCENQHTLPPLGGCTVVGAV